ncbi:cytochrome P450 [Stigmatella aurantiaca]|uniref:Cytochrome P450 n=1 Tax=Stigmatella aurantiaca (strain DW4/3-1) TaxID=378806 RepID=Q09D70_STIAD|nr:cytochrome P450 [Stigmatella aurantiaca]ADO67836.1 cytochrome P450 [Stigmatella aurantiaca DW4/3-1]EAU69699.1 putative cytochrome P450 135A1 [Stigmatella aurantiaca DW4/3-1]
MHLLPGPGLPPALQIARYRFQPYEFLDGCASRYGDLFTVRFPILGPLVCASRPESIRRIFAASSEELRLGEANDIFRPLFGERSISVLDGPSHLKLRRLSVPLFQGEQSYAWTGMILEVASRRTRRWRPGQHLRLREEMEALTLEVILRALLGLEDPAQLRLASRHARTMVQWSASPLSALLMVPALRRDLGPLTPWKGYHRDLSTLAALVMDQAARRRRARDASGRRDLLSRLMQEGAGLSDEELKDLVLMLLFAGYETTATSLCWAFEALLSHPGERTWVERELAEVTGGGPLEAGHLEHLVRLDSAIKEVLRLYPVVPILGMARRAVRPFELQGVTFPAGTKLVPTSYLAQRRADVYPDPTHFRAARFLDSKPDPASWLPFGGGLRRCVGLPFALHELKAVLAHVLSQTRLRLTRTSPAHASLEGITVGPRGGTPVAVESVRA